MTYMQRLSLTVVVLVSHGNQCQSTDAVVPEELTWVGIGTSGLRPRKLHL